MTEIEAKTRVAATGKEMWYEEDKVPVKGSRREKTGN